MKEFIEQLKLYKELVAIVISVVGGAFFVLGYFATKSALDETREQLNLLVAEKECWLSNRVSALEAGTEIARLERDQLEKLQDKTQLSERLGRSSGQAEKLFLQGRLEKLQVDLDTIAGEIAKLRGTIRQADQALIRSECARRQSAGGHT